MIPIIAEALAIIVVISTVIEIITSIVLMRNIIAIVIFMMVQNGCPQAVINRGNIIFVEYRI